MSKKLRAHNRQLRRAMMRSDAHHNFVFAKLLNERERLCNDIARLSRGLTLRMLCAIRPWL